MQKIIFRYFRYFHAPNATNTQSYHLYHLCYLYLVKSLTGILWFSLRLLFHFCIFSPYTYTLSGLTPCTHSVCELLL